MSSKIDNTLLGLTLGIGALLLLTPRPQPHPVIASKALRQKLPEPHKNKYAYLKSGGPLYKSLTANGYEHEFTVNKLLNIQESVAMAHTTGIYSGNKVSSAEILMLITPESGIDVDEGRNIYKSWRKIGLNPNFDFHHTKTGFYVCPNSVPLVKLNIPVKSDVTYTKRVLASLSPEESELSVAFGSHKQGVEYSVSSSNGHHETVVIPAINTSGSTYNDVAQKWTAVNDITIAAEYLIRRTPDNLDERLPPFPLELVNRRLTGISTLNGIERYMNLGQCIPPQCIQSQLIDKRCKICTDPGLHCRDNKGRQLSCSTHMPSGLTDIPQPHLFARQFQSSLGSFLPKGIYKLTTA